MRLLNVKIMIWYLLFSISTKSERKKSLKMRNIHYNFNKNWEKEEDITNEKNKVKKKKFAF